jgi:hypothetical protein
LLRQYANMESLMLNAKSKTTSKDTSLQLHWKPHLLKGFTNFNRQCKVSPRLEGYAFKWCMHIQ